MKPLWSIILLVLTTTLTFGQTELRYNLNPGNTFKIRQNVTQVTTQKMGEASHEITSNMGGILEFQVLGETEQGYKLSLYFRELTLAMKSNLQGALFSVDTKVNDTSNVQSKIFGSLLHQPITIQLSKTGAIIAVEGGDALIAQMSEASGLEDEFSKAILETSLAKEFGSKALSDSYEQMTYFYPECERIAIGEQWQNSYIGKLEAENTWTLDSITPETYHISGISGVVMHIENPETVMNLSGSQKTSIEADRLTGFIRSMTVWGESEGISTIVQLGNQQIPTSMSSTITYQLIND